MAAVHWSIRLPANSCNDWLKNFLRTRWTFSITSKHFRYKYSDSASEGDSPRRSFRRPNVVRPWGRCVRLLLQSARRWLHVWWRHRYKVLAYQRLQSHLSCALIVPGRISDFVWWQAGDCVVCAKLLLSIRKPSEYTGTWRTSERVLQHIWGRTRKQKKKGRAPQVKLIIEHSKLLRQKDETSLLGRRGRFLFVMCK